jgi:RHS repeat-associated protein
VYGSSRIGTRKLSSERSPIIWQVGTFSAACYGNLCTNIISGELQGTPIPLLNTRGQKFFELSNHLGNVLVTITDQKVWTIATAGNYYAATVASATDYLPFGQVIAGRQFHTSDYRFGYNAKENDGDWGTQLVQDYGGRVYASGMCRFLSVDPLVKKLPHITPYSYAADCPILLIDKDGNFPIIPFLIKGAAGGMISALMQFSINMIIYQDADKAFHEINWYEVGLDALSSAVPWNPPGGRWGKAAVVAATSVTANALNGKYNNLADGSEVMMAASKDFFVSYLISLGANAAAEKFGTHVMPKIAKWLTEKGYDKFAVKKLTGRWYSKPKTTTAPEHVKGAKLETDVANHLDDNLGQGTVKDIGSEDKVFYKGEMRPVDGDVVLENVIIECKSGKNISEFQIGKEMEYATSHFKELIVFASERSTHKMKEWMKSHPGIKMFNDLTKLTDYLRTKLKP